MKKPAAVALLGLAYCAAAFAQEAPNYLGRPDCKIAPVQPAPDGKLSWDGKCSDGYATGPGVLEWRDASGKFRLEATLAAGQIVGEGTLKYPDGATYIGTFTNGVANGKGYFRLADGMQYEGDVVNGKREGLAEGVFANGDRYIGHWKDGEPDGTGRNTYMLGGEYDGEWKQGKRHGKGILTYAGSGRRHEGQFVDDRLADAAPLPKVTATYNLKDKEPRFDRLTKYDIVRGSEVPLDVEYDALTPEQKRLVNSYFPALEEGDEPPYPRRGVREFYYLMAKVAGNYGMPADLRVYVLVDTDGKAEEVTAMGVQDNEIRRIAGTAAAMLEYKPARCAGTPCKMMYRFSVHLYQTLW